MRVKDGVVEIRITLEPETYESIIDYLNSDEPSEISMFIEEVVKSYVEMHKELIEENE